MSTEETKALLRRWYDEALQVFSRPWHGAPAFEREFGGELIEALLAPGDGAMEALINKGHKRNAAIVAELETGRDRLLELASFDGAAASRLQAAIAEGTGRAAALDRPAGGKTGVVFYLKRLESSGTE